MWTKKIGRHDASQMIDLGSFSAWFFEQNTIERLSEKKFKILFFMVVFVLFCFVFCYY